MPLQNDAMVPTTPRPMEPPVTPSPSVLSKDPSEQAIDTPQAAEEDGEHLTRKVALVRFVRDSQLYII